MTEKDIKYLSHKNQKNKNKRSNGENHIVAVSKSKKEKIKDIPKGENLSEAPKGEILDILPSHFSRKVFYIDHANTTSEHWESRDTTHHSCSSIIVSKRIEIFHSSLFKKEDQFCMDVL